MPGDGIWIAKGTSWMRHFRGDRVTNPPPPFPRPTGPGYYAIEDLNVPLTAAGFTSAMAQVKALPTGIDTVIPGRVHRTLTLPGTNSSPFIISANGFAAGTGAAGFLFEEGVGVVGSGPRATIFEVAPDSITQAQVDVGYTVAAYPATIGLRVMAIPNGDAARGGTTLSNCRFAQFGLRGTQQRVNGTQYPNAQVVNWNTYHYTGMSLTRNAGLVMEDVDVWGIPGYKNSPPGETAQLSVLRGDSHTFRRVHVDGRNDAGTAVGAAGLATNSTANVLIENCTASYMGFSHGFAFWQTNNMDIYDSSSTHNGGIGSAELGGVAGDGFNFERSRDSRLIRATVGFNTLGELRYYGRNDGDSYDGDTSPHYVENIKVIDGGNLDILIRNVQTTRPTFGGVNPTPAYI